MIVYWVEEDSAGNVYSFTYFKMWQASPAVWGVPPAHSVEWEPASNGPPNPGLKSQPHISLKRPRYPSQYILI